MDTVGGFKEIANLIKPNSDEYKFYKELVLNDVKEFTYFFLLEEFFKQKFFVKVFLRIKKIPQKLNFWGIKVKRKHHL